MASQLPVSSPDYLINVKVHIDDTNRRFKLPLKDLNAAVFSSKMRDLLQIPADHVLLLERYSDSSSSYVPLDSRNHSAYKQLFRAAKAKLKLRLKASHTPFMPPAQTAPSAPQEPAPASKAESPQAAATSTAEIKPAPSAPKCTKYDGAPRLLLSQLLQEVADSRNTNTGENGPKPAAPSNLRTSLFDGPRPPHCWQVCCNNCDRQVKGEHYHCNTCDNGDYDLCEACVNAGTVCPGEDHWMIKRSFDFEKGGFANSTTQKVANKAKEMSTPQPKAMPGSFNAETKPAPYKEIAERICNACIRPLPQEMTISCKDCRDYDLCMPCLLENQHGHHPGHTFVNSMTSSQSAKSLCQPGRNVRHQAVCDNCEKTIFGVRYKCLDCPDFDFCAACYGVKKSTHNHRFVPAYEALPVSAETKARHMGVYCDGPLCSGHAHQSYITGTRYKCAVCHDTDFCANCEAHPNNPHNKTHPMIKFKTMVQGVSIETHDSNETRTTVVGDNLPYRPAPRAPSTSTLPGYTASAQPGEALPAYSPKTSMSAPMTVAPSANRPQASAVAAADLKAEFIRDAIADGTSMHPALVFDQTWAIHNPGPHTWPAGCSVRHVGGDYMLNVDQKGPSSVAQLSKAQESNSTLTPVLPGQIVHFNVQMKAPSKPGKHISYWRLKSPDGTPFGHKLWCDIQVVPAPWEPSSALCDNPSSECKNEEDACESEDDESENEDDESENEEDESDIEEDESENKKPKSEVLAGYHMDLMLLEQQNKRRLMLARIEQQLCAGPTTTSDLQSDSRGNCTDEPPKQEGLEQLSSKLAAKLESTASTMVFPKLEKESPASSMHQESPKSAATTEAIKSSSVAIAAKTETGSLADEVTAKDEFDSDSDEDDGFLTDEEYDILDASDEEIINGTAA